MPVSQSLFHSHRSTIEWVSLGAMLIALGGFVSFSLFQEHQRIDGYERERLATQAKVIEENLARQLDGINHALLQTRIQLAQWKKQPDGREAGNHYLMTLSDAMPSVRAMTVLDANGIVDYASRPELVGRDFSKREYFTIARSNPNPNTLFVSSPTKTSLGVYSVLLVRTVPDPGGRFAGIVTATLDPDEFRVLLSSTLFRPDMIASLIHGDGTLFFAIPPRPDVVGTNMAKPGSFFTRHLASGKWANVLTGATAAYGAGRMGAVRTIQPADLSMDKPLVVAVGRDLDAIFASWREEARTEWGWYGIFAIVLSVSLLVYQRRRGRLEAAAAENEAKYKAAQGIADRERVRLETILKTASDGIHIVDGDGVLIEANQAFLNMLGYDYSAIGTLRVEEWDAQSPWSVIKARNGDLIAHRSQKVFETRHQRRDGKIVDVEISAAGIEIDGKGYLYAASRDITERKRAANALRESEERFRSLTEISSDFYWESDTEHRITRRGSASQPSKMSAFHRGALVGERRWEIPSLSPDEAGWKAHRATLDAHLPFRNFEVSRLGTDGKEHYVSVSGDPIFDAAGAFMGYRGVVTDITERKWVEIDLRKLSQAVEQSPASIVITDNAGKIEYVNPRFEAATGYTRAEAMGQNPRILKSGENAPEVYEQLWATISSGREWRGELCNRRKNGELFWELASIAGVTGRSDKIEHYVAVKEDITERKRMEEALRESESRLAAVFHASPIAIVVTSVAEGRLLEVNDAALRLYGSTRDAVIGRTAAELGTYANLAQREELARRVREQGQVEHFEIDFRTSKGEVGLLELSGRVIELRGDQFLVAMMVDITERKRLEQAHLQAQKLESLGTLAGGIAHDFNNILAAIQGNADLGAKIVGPDHLAADNLAEIRKASARATELVRRIMTFGQPSEAKPEVVNLGEVVNEVLKLLRSTLPAGISLRMEFAGDTPAVLADAGQVHEVIVNLTTNAAYAIGSQTGWIEYRLEPVQVGDALAQSILGLKQGRYARLTVSDSGCGMDAAVLGRIFDAFFTTKPVGKGTGLGLSLVHGIMRNLGGAITVESTPGKGSSFVLYFPAVDGQAIKKELIEPALPAVATGKRVLYVDDEEALVLLAGRALTRLGHQVTGFTDPEEALKAFGANPQAFDVVVTDLSMPHMSGFDLAREVLALRPNMPVLMTTGYIRAEDEHRAGESGIRELLPKPATMEELGQALDRLVRHFH